ncbi:MAG: GGDEF domain-containing protein [Congregibacter sp.]
MSDREDWKKRYLKEVQDWEATDELLRKVLGRLIIAAEGNSSDLDAVLVSVQRHARERDDKSLAGALDALTRQIRLLDSPVKAAPKEATKGAARDAAKDAIKAAAKEPTQAPAPEPLKAPTSAGNNDVCKVLLALIDEVAVTQPDLGSLDTLRESLQRDGGADWYRVLERVMGEIRGLIQRISNDKQALEQLMIEVSDELGDITQVLVEDRSDLTAGREQTRELNEIVASGVERIQTHIDTAADIETLKSTVHHSLEGMRQGIAEFVEKDAQRFADYEARNDSLQQRVARMETESRELQTKLSENREKLMLDTLTGVRSRLAYDETLAQELSRYNRYREVFSLAVLDIDHFKHVNDTYGHTAGDKALKLLAGLIDESIRETDFLFRVGGEEFVLLLPRTDLTNAQPLVERVRAAVSDSGFHYESKPVPLTVSAGLSEVHEDDSSETLFARADDALYRAKKGGRNKLVVLD